MGTGLVGQLYSLGIVCAQAFVMELIIVSAKLLCGARTRALYLDFGDVHLLVLVNMGLLSR